jgi:hypothetical protein
VSISTQFEEIMSASFDSKMFDYPERQRFEAVDFGEKKAHGSTASRRGRHSQKHAEDYAQQVFKMVEQQNDFDEWENE